MSTNAEETDPGSKSVLDKAKAANAAADPWFDRALDWLKGSAWTPVIVVALLLPAVWVLVRIIIWFAGAV